MLQVLATVHGRPAGRAGPDATGGTPRPRLIGSLPPLTPEDTVRGQYEGYLDVEGVDPHSTVETYVAVRLASTRGGGRACRS